MGTDDQPRSTEQRAVNGERVVPPIQVQASKIVGALPRDIGVALSKVLTHDATDKLSHLADRLDQELGGIRDKLEALIAENEDRRRFAETEWPMLAMDGFRRAERTRASDRIDRIAAILANALTIAPQPDADEVEEMMRIAGDLADRDVVASRLITTSLACNEWNDRLSLKQATDLWKTIAWRSNGFSDSEVESICGKLASFGLLARLDLPPNQNFLTSEHNGYELLQKGKRFVRFIERSRTG